MEQMNEVARKLGKKLPEMKAWKDEVSGDAGAYGKSNSRLVDLDQIDDIFTELQSEAV